MWYDSVGKDKDVVISTRVRLARNLQGYAFDERLSADNAAAIIDKVKSVFGGNDSWRFTDLAELSENERRAMAEKHIISPQFALKKGNCALLSCEDKSVYIMLLEEDHMRIQCIRAGFDIELAAETAFGVEDIIDTSLPIAYDEKLGYLTHCPTNLGTGMRASVMLHLPALTYSGRMKAITAQLSKLGLTVRGMNGEGSEADGCIYQISNQVTLGISEQETIDKLRDTVSTIVEKERELREKRGDSAREEISDRVMRNIGILTYATKMSTRELISIYSDLRLGVSLGIVNIPYELLDKLLIECMPNMLTVSDPKISTPLERDKLRAEKIRKIMGLTGYKK